MLSRVLIVLFAHLSVGFAEKKEGDVCVDEYTNTVGRCAAPEDCPAARENFDRNGIVPTFCVSTFYTTLVCCAGRGILQTAPPSLSDKTGPVWGTSDSSSKERVSVRKCKEYSSYVTKPVQFLPLLPIGQSLSIDAPQCGYGKVELIIGGQKAELGEFPHMAAIGWANFEGTYSFSCGGSLISERFVMTAGHCTRDPRARDPQPVIVRLGDRNIDPRVDDGASPVDIPIKRIHKHPAYAPPARYNDIALLELATDAEFGARLRPACLWAQPTFQDDKAVATGWGVASTKTQKASDDLLKVSLSILENDFCDRLLQSTKNRKWHGFEDTQLCAGELKGGKDTCQGDSGAPLQVTSRENNCMYHIIGITSFGKKCAQQDKPAIYTRVSAFVDWIESVVWPGE